jgi:hypothetical protein
VRGGDGGRGGGGRLRVGMMQPTQRGLAATRGRAPQGPKAAPAAAVAAPARTVMQVGRRHGGRGAHEYLEGGDCQRTPHRGRLQQVRGWLLRRVLLSSLCDGASGQLTCLFLPATRPLTHPPTYPPTHRAPLQVCRGVPDARGWVGPGRRFAAGGLETEGGDQRNRLPGVVSKRARASGLMGCDPWGRPGKRKTWWNHSHYMSATLSLFLACAAGTLPLMSTWRGMGTAITTSTAMTSARRGARRPCSG